MHTSRGHTVRGFTLIELLVVIGVIAVLAGAIGLGFRDTNPTMAVRTAQGMVSSLVTAARAQAAINGGNAAIVVWGNKDDPDTFLRQAAVFSQFSDPASGTMKWRQEGAPVVFPMGAYMVPPEADDVATNDRARLEPTLADWKKTSGTPQFAALSEAKNATSTSVTGPTTLPMLDGRDLQVYQMITFSSLGTIFASEHKVVIGNAERESSGASTVLVFRNPEAVRGVSLSVYGIPTLVNGKLGF